MSTLSNEARHLRCQLAERSLWAFTKTYLPEHIKHPPSAAHQELYALLEGMAVHRGKRLAVAAPRGFGKSTMTTLSCVLHGICYGREQFITILSSTGSQATQLLEAVRRELEENEKLRADFPAVVGPHPHPWTRSEIVTSNYVRVLALGSGQRIRGRKHGKDRPTLTLGDDLENAESAFSLESRERLKDWFNRSVLKAGAEATNVVLLGTLHHPYCLLAEYVDPSVHPEWIKRVFKAVLSWSSHPELEAKFSQIYNGREVWEEKRGPEAAKLFYEAHQQALEEGVKLLWEARWSCYELLVEREEDPIGFSSERQNEPLDLRFCSFNLEEYGYWCDQFRTVEALLQALGDHVVFYAACDPALGLDATRGDYTAIVIIAKDTRDNSLYVIVADIQRYTPTQAINALFAYYQRYRFRWLSVETNQFQELLVQEIERRGRELGVTLPIKRIKNMGDKVGRIQSIQPALKSHRVKLYRGHTLLLEQLRFHPKARHDDGPDALEMAIRITEELPAVELTIVGGDSEPWWRDYERNLGWKIF